MARAPSAFAQNAQQPIHIDITVEEQPLQQLAYYANKILAFFMTPYGAVVLGLLGVIYYYRVPILEKLCSFRDWVLSFFYAHAKYPQQTLLVDTYGMPIDIRTQTRLGMLDALRETEKSLDPDYDPNRGGGPRPK